MTPDTSGPTSLVPLAHYDPDSSSWRTSGVMFPSDWPTSSETCPAWGMTRGGELFALPTPELRTGAPASSSSLLPTPKTTDDRAGTPADLNRHQPGLRALPMLLPTPTVNDMGAGKTVEDWDAWTERMQERHGNGNGHGASLSIEALRLLPTPLASDGEKGGPNQRGGSGDLRLSSAVQLLPTPTAMDAAGLRGFQSNGEPYTATAGVTLTDASLALSGAHMPPRSPVGNTSSDDQLPGQLSLDEPASA